LQKRESRNVLRDLNALQRQTLLQACFVSWKGLETQDPAFANDVQIQFHHLLRDQDHAIAQALAEFRRLGRLVTSCSRTDDICFYENLLAAGAEHLAPAQARELWKIIKRNLPKYKNRRLGIDPLRMMSLEDEWNPHFKELEAGCVITPDELMQGAQTATQMDLAMMRPPVEIYLPSLSLNELFEPTNLGEPPAMTLCLQHYTTTMLRNWLSMPFLSS
jgi:hypothetical protein